MDRNKAERSISEAGDIAHKPQCVTAVVVTGTKDDPEGVLEDWGGDEWIYADADDLLDIN